MFPRNWQSFLRICCRTAPLMSISTDSKAATSLSSAAEHRQPSLQHYFMKRAPTSDWSQDSSPSCFIRASGFHAPSPKQFDGRYPRSGPDGSLDSLRTCRSYSTTFRSRCKIVSLKAFLAPPGGGSCADALTTSRSWRAIRSKKPKHPTSELFYRSGQGMATRGESKPSTSLRQLDTAPIYAA